MLEREQSRDSSFNEANETIAEWLNYCLMGKNNLLAGLLGRCRQDWGGAGGEGQLPHPRKGGKPAPQSRA